MKKLYCKLNTFIITSALILLSAGCETTDFGVVESTNALNPSQADIDFFLNAIQLELGDFFAGEQNNAFDGMSEFGMEATRMLHGGGPSYDQLAPPPDFNEIWESAYSRILADIRVMTPLAEEAELFTHVAIGQIVEAYVIMTLVDFFGDVPYTEAVRGSEGITNPALDDEVSIYEAANQLLLDAITNLNREEFALPARDLFYPADGGSGPTNESQWVRLANTLRLKLFLQTRLANETSFNAAVSTAEINALIAGNNLIMNSADDFAFRYGTSINAPDARHPFFQKNYGGAGPSADFIMANYYMNLLANRYGQEDPRTRYYYYRQVSDFSGQNVVNNSCSTQNAPAHYPAGETFCTVPNTNGYDGLWGWDHLRDDGIPPHDAFLAMFGVYPIGGPFDDSSFRNVTGSTANEEGLAGAGIAPIMMSSYTYFMLAEAAENLGTTGDAASYLESGIRESIGTVVNFGEQLSSTLDRVIVADDPDTPENEQVLVRDQFVPSPALIDTHVAEIMADFNGSVGADRLRVLGEQYFLALWCNGVEAYNTYRRTGQPDNLQPSLDLADPGVYVRSNFYPQVANDNNASITQKAGVTTPIFWDTNPEGFVD
ncbi:MAG: SusD/RagB family nutrient-binding outer membrane lipoprotein [Bacteroidota bacterium]